MIQMPLPAGVPVARVKPRPTVAVPDGQIPLIAPDAPDHEKVQYNLTARVKVFDLSDAAQRAECEEVWQKISDGLAKYCEHRTEFIAHESKFVQLLRWADLDYKLPSTR